MLTDTTIIQKLDIQTTVIASLLEAQDVAINAVDTSRVRAITAALEELPLYQQYLREVLAN